MAESLGGYRPDQPIVEKDRRAFAAVFPLLVEFLLEEFIPQHVIERRRRSAEEDLETRLRELLIEARWNVAINRPDEVLTSYISKRDFALSRPPKDRRTQRRKLPREEELLSEYRAVIGEIRHLLPRRRAASRIPKQNFEELRQRFPELGWQTIDDSVGATPTTATQAIIASRHGVGKRRVERALRMARRRPPPC